MKQLLRIICAQLLACLSCSVFAQTTLTYSTAGTFAWSPPAGVTSITLQMWGAGGYGIYGGFSGGGGAFVQTSSIPVVYGTTYNIVVGSGFASVAASSFGAAGESAIVIAQGGSPISNAGGAASTGPYVLTSYRGGNGAYPADLFSPAGGGAGAGTCGAGADGSQGFGYGVGSCGGGSGGDPNGTGVGGAPGGGGAAIFGNNNTFGGSGKVILTYTCNVGTTGQIGNGHTVSYPPKMIPDYITSLIDPQLESDVSITWQQSTDNINFVTAKTPNTSTVYRFDLDSLQTTTYYRRGNNACLTAGTIGNWSDTVRIKVFTQDNGSNGKITGFVQSRNGTAIVGRKVYTKNLTPLRGRAVGSLDSAYTDDQGKFSIENIFYGDKNNGDSATVRFNVYPDTTGKHLYDPANATLSLTTSSPTYDIVKRFSDTTTFAVTGQVTQICYGCLNKNNKVDTITGTVDSVKIVGIGARHPNPREIDSSYTGYRNPPKKYGNYGLIFQEEDTYKVTATFKNHKIIPKDTTFYLGGNVSNVNFVDTSTRVISGFFGAGCNDIIGTAVLEFYDSLPKGFNGKVRTSEFRKRVTTSANGNYSIRLPARAYNVKIISVTINDPIDPLTKASTVKSYFLALPASDLYRDITTNNKTLNLVYQREPAMAISGLYDDSIRVATCPAFKNYDFWPQSVRRPVTFKVYQGPVSRGCLVDTGTVYVTTDISSSLGVFNHDTVKLKKGIGVDSIVAAQPNTVINPGTGTYSKKFTATFKDILGRGVSTDTLKPALPIVVVTGAAVDPGGTNFVTVSPQVPFLVLHDPPGSNSFAKWSKAVKSSQAISFKAQKEKTEGGFVNITIGLSQILGMFVEIPVEFWATIDNKFSTTNTTTNTSESVITNTAEQAFETANDVPYVASDADLIYGAALNINYKVGTEIEWDSIHCQVLNPRPIMVMDIKNDTTSFLYTQGYIKDQEIPRLQFAAAAQKNPDSAAYFNNQIKVWQQLVDNNEKNIKEGAVLQNISFSNGTSQTFSNTLENSTTDTYDFDLSIDKELAISLGFEVAGTGIDGGYNVAFKMVTGSSTKTENSTTTTTSYTLADNNAGGPTYEGDYLSVNVKKDPVYGTPMFETVAGGTQCPHEEGTLALDHPVITANVTTLTGVKKDTANFTVYLNNLSHDATPGGKRPYILFLNAASNPSGATVLIGGTSSPDGVTYIIPNNGGVQPVTISVIRNTSSGVYNYDNLEFIMTDPCFPPVVQAFFSNPHEYSSIELSADFQSPVSGVTLVSPVNNWVANKASNNIIPVKFNDYDTSKLTSIALQYSVPGTGNWQTGFTVAKKDLGSSSTTTNWDISKIADGPYNLRLRVRDKNNNVIYSKVVKGKIDRQPPQLFGTPQPASAIYTPGTQISYSYTENINNTNLRNGMVRMRDMTSKTNIQVQLSAFGNTLIVVPKVDITTYAGHLFRVIADSVADLNGNVKTIKDTMYFNVGSTNFSTGPDALNVTAGKTSIYEDAKGSLDVRFARNSKVTGPVVIYYNICGDAVYNKDYIVTYNNGQTPVTGINGAQGAIVLPKDSLAVTMYIKPINDSIVTPDKILTITLSAGGGYSIGSSYSVSDTILNHNTVAPVITANNSTTLCLGDSVVLSTKNKINGVEVSSYRWSTGAKTKSITVKQSGSYTVKVTDINGFTGYSAPTDVSITCASPSGLSAVVLNKRSAVLNWVAVDCAKKYVVQYKQVGQPGWVSDTVNVNTDTIKGLKANTQYRWQVASICQYPVIVISGYTAGTNFTTPASLTEIAVTSTRDYTKAAAGDGFSASVYPNPTSNSAILEVKGTKGPYNVIVMNLQGAVLWKAQELTGNYIKLPLSSFAEGTYMVIVFDKEHTGRLKLVKQ